MGISLLALGTFFLFKDALGANLRYFSVGAVLIYIIFFAISLGPLGWLIISEIFPLKVRGLGMAVQSIASNRYSCFIGNGV